MHWLAAEVKSLRALAANYDALRVQQRSAPNAVADERAARAELHVGVQELLEALFEHDTVEACFVQHDGLLVDARGDPAYAEALAAMGQSFLVPARRAASLLNLGPMQQVLLSGGEKKLVLVQIGPFTLGLLASATARLGVALASRP